jgi:hypothetical protein
MRQININSFIKQREEGRLYGTTNTGQQEYDAALSPKGVKPSVTSPMRTFLACQANSRSKLSKAFHTSESEGCIITSLFSLTIFVLSHMNHTRFFLRETFILVEVQWACNELAYVQPLMSPFHHHHLRPRHTSIYHISNICFLPCVPFKKSIQLFWQTPIFS